MEWWWCGHNAQLWLNSEKSHCFCFPCYHLVLCHLQRNHLTIVLGKIKIWNVIYVFLSMARAALSIHLHLFGNVDLICNESVRNLACGKVTVDGGKITSRQKSSRRQTFCFLLNKSHCRLLFFEIFYAMLKRWEMKISQMYCNKMNVNCWSWKRLSSLKFLFVMPF